MTTTFRTHDGRTLEQAASDLVQREVLCCMSGVVSTLAQAYACVRVEGDHTRAVSDLADQAYELAAPALDYEAAAREAGWYEADGFITSGPDYDPTGVVDTWEEACDQDGIEPHELEVYEHWAVSTWLAERLQAAGERVDTDFAGLCVWARTTTGQAIHADAVIEQITREMHAPVKA